LNSTDKPLNENLNNQNKRIDSSKEIATEQSLESNNQLAINPFGVSPLQILKVGNLAES